ncbi:uncharacterized protein [Diadema setosum]|uniref:uncharacterized protein n=1 Tax=Diadema setosum TaxID=31175 RepID=UPI003B3B20E4
MTDHSRKYLLLSTADLKQYLRARRVPINNERHSELAEKAYWAEKLDLPVKPSDKEAEQDISETQQKKLILDGGLTRLPRPETLTSGWEDGPASLPDTSRDHLDSFIKAGNRRIGLIKTEGKRTLALGKGLYMSGHVQSVQYHGINPNVCYCFVRGKVVPQVKTSEQAYSTWIVLQKETARICTAECNCCIGVQATCKHIAALLFAVVEAVEEGRNSSCTSQPKTWGLPAKKSTKEALHQPQFAENIKVVSVKPDVLYQESTSSRGYRSSFDPRLQHHRNKRTMEDFNLEWLASITNGNCGLLAYSKRNSSEQHAIPNIDDVVRYETVVSCDFPLTVREALQNQGSVERMELSTHQQQVIISSTKQQADSSLWKRHRIGRITASVAGDCAAAVRDGIIHGHSQIARVMGYYGSPCSSALKWGKSQEKIAIRQYTAVHRLKCKNSNIVCEETGLWISTKFPYIAASPDAIISCKRCGEGLLEVKNPFTHRRCTISELVTQKGSCLIHENGTNHLNRQHHYFAQVQVQLWVTGKKWCDFVVRTVSQRNNLHVERITLDGEYVEHILPRIHTFFHTGIIPEIESGRVEDIVINNAVQKTMNLMLDKLESPGQASKDVLYPCGICSEECEATPDDENKNSIACDSCDRWLHYRCVGITGEEPFLRRRKSVWKCNTCTSKLKTRKRIRIV